MTIHSKFGTFAALLTATLGVSGVLATMTNPAHAQSASVSNHQESGNKIDLSVPPPEEEYLIKGKIVVSYPCVPNDYKSSKAASEAIEVPPTDCDFPYLDGLALIRGNGVTLLPPTNSSGQFFAQLPAGDYSIEIIHPASFSQARHPECGSSSVSVPLSEPLVILCAPAEAIVNVSGSVTDWIHPCPVDADCADVLVPADGYKVTFESPHQTDSTKVQSSHYAIQIVARQYLVTITRPDRSTCAQQYVYVPDQVSFEANFLCSRAN